MGASMAGGTNRTKLGFERCFFVPAPMSSKPDFKVARSAGSGGDLQNRLRWQTRRRKNKMSSTSEPGAIVCEFLVDQTSGRPWACPHSAHRIESVQ